jgi:hypothetical protein
MNAKRSRMPIVGIICALAACGSWTASAEAAADPCALLTQARVTAVLGAQVGPGEKITPTACQWSSQRPNSGSARVTVTLYDGRDFAAMRTPLPGIKQTSASGVGDDAFYAEVASLTTLSVKKGNVAFVVRLYGVPGHDKQKAIEKSLALDVLGRL